jgi:hypothetical protein
MPGHKSALNANKLIKDILALMRPQPERQQIELRIDLFPIFLPSPTIPSSYNTFCLISS